MKQGRPEGNLIVRLRHGLKRTIRRNGVAVCRVRVRKVRKKNGSQWQLVIKTVDEGE